MIKFNENNICSVYALGNGMQGQLGVGNYLKTDSPMKVYGLKGLKIKKVSCGVYHSIALDSNGQGKKSLNRSLLLGKVLYADCD